MLILGKYPLKIDFIKVWFRNDITEILLKVALNAITLTLTEKENAPKRIVFLESIHLTCLDIIRRIYKMLCISLALYIKMHYYDF
jgi:hypothetical protein